MDLERKRLNNADKVIIAEYYIKNKEAGVTAKEVADHYGIKSHTCILDWQKNLDELRAQSEISKKIKPSHYTRYPVLEKELMHWI